MAAPTPTVRGTPAGIKLEDGFVSKITLSQATAVSLWEKSVKPPGIDGGDPISTTTMFNVDWHTMAARKLKKLTDGSFKAAYDPEVYTSIVSAINRPDTVTHLFPDGSTLAVYGYLKSFVPDELVEGTMPEATCEIVYTNWDYVNKVMAGPVMTSVAGT